MKLMRFLFLISLSIAVLSCKKDDGGTTPPPTTSEDFSFPANATKFSATLYAPTQTVANGGTFDIRLVLYNITDAFGAAAEIAYSGDKVQITESVVGPAFTPSDAIISLRGPVNATTYAFGVTYKAGTNRTTTGSGVIVKLKCRAIASGAATFSITPAKLEIKKSDGTPITNFGTILIENASVTVQ
jgi:hypothetical protein